MKLKEEIHLINNRLKNKYNILLIIFLIITLIIMFIISSIHSFYTKSVDDLINNEIGFRTYEINKVDGNIDEEWIKNIEHVKSVYKLKYCEVCQNYQNDILKSDKLDGTIILAPIITEDDIKVSKGKNIKPSDTGKMICPQKFYPDSTIRLFGIKANNMLNGKDFIGTNLKINEKQFKIIGIYNTDKYFSEKNVCYISLSDYNNLSKQNESEAQTYIQIDDIKNRENVLEILKNKGYTYSINYMIDYNEINPLKNVTTVLFIIVPIIAISIIALIMTKKNHKARKNYQLLYWLGYPKKVILKLNHIELTILYFMSIAFSFLIYILLLWWLNNFVFREFLIYSSGLKIESLRLIGISFIFYLIMLILNKRYLNKALKQEVKNEIK